MLARRGIALIPDETELELKNTKERSGSLLLKPNTVVRVTKTADTPTQSGIARVTLTKDGSNHAQLRYAEVLRCHTLFLELPDTSCYVWLLHMLDYCYPFMKMRSSLPLLLHVCGAPSPLQQLPIACGGGCV